MSLPNVTVAFPADVRSAIIQKIEEAKALFPVLTAVSPADRRGLQTIAEGREPYVAEAYRDAKANPSIVPGTLKLDDWTKVEEHHAALDETENAVKSLLELIQGIKATTGDLRYENARRLYKYLGDNLDKLPGAEPVYDRLGKLFAKQGVRAKTATAPKAPV